MRFSLYLCLLAAACGVVASVPAQSSLGQIPVHLQPSEAMPYGLHPITGDYGWRANATPNPLLDKLQCSEGAERAWAGYAEHRQAHLSHLNRHSLCPSPGCKGGRLSPVANGKVANCTAGACDHRPSVWSGSLECQQVPTRTLGTDPRHHQPAPSVLGASPALEPPLPSSRPAARSKAEASTPEKRTSFGSAILDWFNSDPSGNR